MTSREYALRFEAEQQRLIDLLTPLDQSEWGRIGANYPARINDEDEGRSVGVIAHHVAVSADGILERTLAAAQGLPQRPAGDFQAENARHARERADVGKAEVIDLLQRQKGRIATAIRGIPDSALATSVETAVGPMTVAERIERVLIGHVVMHTGSIQAALEQPPPSAG